MKRSWIAALAAPVALAALAALAEARSPRPPDPTDPKAAVPTLRYESAFAGYRRAEATEPAPWKKVNEEVGALGGHAGHLKALRNEAPPPSGAHAPAKPAAHPKP